MSSPQNTFPVLPSAPAEYDPEHQNEVQRSLDLLFTMLQNPGEVRATDLTLTNIPSSSAGLSAGDVYQIDGVLYIAPFVTGAGVVTVSEVVVSFATTDGSTVTIDPTANKLMKVASGDFIRWSGEIGVSSVSGTTPSGELHIELGVTAITTTTKAGNSMFAIGRGLTDVTSDTSFVGFVDEGTSYINVFQETIGGNTSALQKITAGSFLSINGSMVKA